MSGARELYERAIRELDVDAPLPAVGALLLRIARTHLDDNNWPAVADCLEAVLALPDHDALDAVFAEALELRGRMHCSRGDLVQAEHDFQRAREHATAAGNTRLTATVEEDLAAVEVIRGSWAGAVPFLERAVALYRAAEEGANAARTTVQLATLFVDLQRWNAAEQAFAAAIPVAQGRGDSNLLASIELARAQMAVDRANTERARASAERALDLAKEAGNTELVARAVLLNGVVAREQDDFARATRFFDDVERQAESLGDAMLVAELYCERADLFTRQDSHRATLHAMNRAYREMAKLQSDFTTADRAGRLRRLERTFLAVARSWGQRVESSDHDTHGHVERVADLTCEVARRMGVSASELFWYRVAAYLHDIGKLTVPASILNKQGRLSPEEWALVKRHPVAGAELLQDADFPWEVRPIVESHHECWDGSGYPHGLAGEAIPLAARIFAVADVYDALVSRRPFKHVLTHADAVDTMQRDVGRQFDPAVFRVFQDVVREGIAFPGITNAAGSSRVSPLETPIVDDELTAVADAASWTRRAASLLASARGRPHGAALVLIDLDHFAKLNATYGRLQGDDVLWAVAKVLQRGLRAGDLLGRRGGDEFVALLPDATPNVAREVAERLRASVASLHSARRDRPEESVSVSASLAIACAPGDGDSVQTLLAAADRALFHAKRDGRNRVVVADDEDVTEAQSGLDFNAFVGREDELRTLIGLLDSASRAQAKIVGVVGEPGIGKTALIQQLAPEVALRAGALVWGRGEANHGIAGHWVHVLRDLAKSGLLDPRGSAILTQLTTGRSYAEELPPSRAFIEQEIVTAVKRATAEKLLVIALDDMHRADVTTWSILHTLATGTANDRILLVYAIRPDEATQAAEWRRRLAQLPQASAVAVRRFQLDDVRAWIKTVFRDAAPGDDAARFVHTFAEGVPRDALQILRACCDAGSVWYGGTRWEWRPIDLRSLPAGVTAVLQRRVERLPEHQRALLSIAAVLGESLTLELLAAAAGTSEEEAHAALSAAVDATVLESFDRAHEVGYRFRFPQLADACLQLVPERQRQQVHDVAARVLELRAPSRVEAIARHFHAAGNDAAAYACAMRSAERALQTFAHDAALDALQLAQRYAPSSRDLATLRVQYAEVAAAAGRYALANSMCDLALEWLDRQPTESLAHRARRLRYWLATRRGASTVGVLSDLSNLADQQAGSVDAVPTLETAAECAILRCDWPLAEHLAQRALDASGSTAPLAKLLAEAARFVESTSALHTLSRLRSCVDSARERGDVSTLIRALHTLGECVLRAGKGDDAEHVLTEALELARDAHQVASAAAISRTLGELRSRQGRLAEAYQWLGDAERLSAALQDAPERLRTQLTSAIVARHHGDHASALPRFESVERRARELGLEWAELAASAGAALCASTEQVRSERWQRLSERLAEARPNWWFPGRELVDALAVRMALAAGHAGLAFENFQSSAARYAAIDPYALLWLVQEVGEELEAAGLHDNASSRDAAEKIARDLGYTPAIGLSTL